MIRICSGAAAALLFLALCPAAAAPDRHWKRHVVAEGFNSQTAVAADFTRDGIADIVASDISGKDEKVILFIAPDWRPVVIHRGIRTIHFAVMDVNSDGRPDLVACRYHPGLVYWLEQPSDPVREPWPYHVVDDAATGGADGVHGLFATDIDGDGRPDLVASSGQPEGPMKDSLVWYRVPDSGAEGKPWPRYAVADHDAPGLSHYVSAGDVNGDRKTDIASAAKDSPGGNWFAWWEQGQDARQPWRKHLVAENQAGATNVVIADLNRDGKADLVASRGHGTGVLWYEAPKSTPHDLNAAIRGPHALAVGDLDGDGDHDVVTVAKDSRLAVWFENLGKGRFQEHRISDDQSSYDIRLVDLDGDGDLDLLVAGFESKNVVWYENPTRTRSR
jgi:hypothetical protein